MRVFYFWFTEWPAARQLVTEHAPHAQHVWTGPDDGAYWRALAARWTGEDTIVTIEQDVGIHAGVVPEFLACPEPWCAFPSPIGGLTARGLGCTKFSAELQRQVTARDIMCPIPHLDGPGCIGLHCDTRHPGGSACHNRHRGCIDCGSFCFRHLDGPICDALKLLAGLDEPHVHLPPVRHFHYEP